MAFTVPVAYRVKLKETEKDYYLDLVWNWKKLWNMNVTFIPIIFGAFGRVTEGY